MTTDVYVFCVTVEKWRMWGVSWRSVRNFKGGGKHCWLKWVGWMGLKVAGGDSTGGYCREGGIAVGKECGGSRWKSNRGGG